MFASTHWLALVYKIVAIQLNARSDRQLVGPAVAAEPLRVRAFVQIDPASELIFVDGHFLQVLIIAIGQAGLRQVGQRSELLEQIHRSWIETAGRDLIARECRRRDSKARAALVRNPDARQRILQRSWDRREIARSHSRCHRREELRRSRARLESFVVRHEEQPVLAIEYLRDLYRARQGEAVLILPVWRFAGAVWVGLSGSLKK